MTPRHVEALLVVVAVLVAVALASLFVAPYAFAALTDTLHRVAP